MRTTILIGLILVAMGAMALYQVRNGFFMAALGYVAYSPLAEAEEAEAAFSALADTPSETPGVTLGDVADARLRCAQQMSGSRANETAAAAFRRLNLMLLGVGVDSFAPVIDPVAYRVTELRRGLTRDALPWRGQALTQAEGKVLEDIFRTLINAEHEAYLGLGLTEGFAHYDFTALVEVMRRGEAQFHDCVTEARY